MSDPLRMVARSAPVLIVAFIAISFCAWMTSGQVPRPKFRVIAIAEKGGVHQQFVDTARIWLAREAAVDGFSIDYIESTDKIDEAFLSQCQLFIQLNYPPYAWKSTAMRTFEKYIEEGKGGWIGFYHATLLGEFDGYPMWPWFSTSWAAFASPVTSRRLSPKPSR